MEQAAETSYEWQLAEGLAVHYGHLRQMVASSQHWGARTVLDARNGLATGHDVTAVLGDYAAHCAALPAELGKRLQQGQDDFADQFARSPLDAERWRAIQSYVQHRPLTPDIPMHIDMVAAPYSRWALRAALDLDVWRQLQADRKSDISLVMASTPIAARLMATALDSGRGQRILNQINRFSVGSFVAAEMYAKASPKTQTAAGFLLRMYTGHKRNKLLK